MIHRILHLIDILNIFCLIITVSIKIYINKKIDFYIVLIDVTIIGDFQRKKK